MSLTELTGNPRHGQVLMQIGERGYMNNDGLARCAVIFVNSASRD